MHRKITNDVHEALVNKLHLMGFIKPELHHKWLITTDGKANLNAVEHQKSKKVIPLRIHG